MGQQTTFEQKGFENDLCYVDLLIWRDLTLLSTLYRSYHNGQQKPVPTNGRVSVL